MEQIIYDVFICYTRNDYNAVSEIVNYLSDNGISCWFDKKNLSPDNVLINQIVNAIERSQVFIYIHSHNGNISQWMRKEIDIAQQLKKTIIPLKLDSSNYPSLVGWYLCDIDYIYVDDDGNWKSSLRTCLMKHLNRKQNYKTSEIFVSYKRQDRKEAIGIITRLRECGFTCWSDIDGLYACSSLDSILIDAIDSCKVFVALLSGLYEKSMWCYKELSYAKSKNKPIVYAWILSSSHPASQKFMERHQNALHQSDQFFYPQLFFTLTEYNCKCDCYQLFEEAQQLKEKSLGSANAQLMEKVSFSLMLRAMELGSKDASLSIGQASWDLDIKEILNTYHMLVDNNISNYRNELYHNT